jgi:hypothetical protein
MGNARCCKEEFCYSEKAGLNVAFQRLAILVTKM